MPQDLSNCKQEQRDADDTNKKNQREPFVPLRLCYDTFVLLLLISITVIATIYISHIQKHVQEVDARADNLAARVLSLEKLVETLMSGETAMAVTQNIKWENQDGSVNRVVRDAKRSIIEKKKDEPVVKLSRRSIFNEPEHILREHHGIGEQNIAYITADREKLLQALNQSITGFVRRHHPTSNCLKLYENQLDGQHLCTGSESRPYDLYMTSRGNHRYKFMATAPWMQDYSTFDYNDNGELTVQRSGIYIIHSNIHFTDKSDEPDYGVYYRRNRPNTGESDRFLISKCQVSAADKEGSGVFPCPTWQLIPLKAGDRVYMRISGYNWFRIEKETFHLALIRLNNWPGL